MHNRMRPVRSGTANGSTPPGRRGASDEEENDMSAPWSPQASFGTKKRNVPGVIQRGTAMYNAIEAAPATFPSPPIDMVRFLALITALSEAQQRVKGTGAKGAA